MPNRPAEIIVRCEDLQQRVFVYRCLTEKGFPGRTIQIRHCPAGDAKHFVLNEYPAQVKTLRSARYLCKALVSMLDADDHTVEERMREHDKALESIALARRASTERIAILIPRRNIETWIHYLLGEPVKEENEYPRFRGDERRCAPAAVEFARRCPHNMRDADPPSLRVGCTEFRRILP